VIYPTCNFLLKAVDDVSKTILQKTASGDPLSLIRLGDGEGLLLSVSPESPESDFSYLTKHLGSAGMDPDFVAGLRERMIEAIYHADFLGVRNDIVGVEFDSGNFSLPAPEFLQVFRQQFKLREIEKTLDYHAARRIGSLHSCLSRLNLRENMQFCSAWIHYDFHRSGKIFEILERQERVGLISCRSELPDLMKKLLGVEVKYLEIPDMYRDLPKSGIPEDYIPAFEHLFSQNLVDQPGMLYLVGGGLYGKLYCQLIRSQGGIAIDLGSLFDAWLGIPSRRLVYRSMFGSAVHEKNVPTQLLLSAENCALLHFKD
jgi:hypothetical protein